MNVQTGMTYESLNQPVNERSNMTYESLNQHECSKMAYNQPEVTVNTTQDIQSLIKFVWKKIKKIKKMLKEPFHTFKQKPLMEITNKELSIPTYTCTIPS